MCWAIHYVRYATLVQCDTYNYTQQRQYTTCVRGACFIITTYCWLFNTVVVQDNTFPYVSVIQQVYSLRSCSYNSIHIRVHTPTLYGIVTPTCNNDINAHCKMYTPVLRIQCCGHNVPYMCMLCVHGEFFVTSHTRKGVYVNVVLLCVRHNPVSYQLFAWHHFFKSLTHTINPGKVCVSYVPYMTKCRNGFATKIYRGDILTV